MVRFFYFGEATIELTGEACMFPLSSFLGIQASNTVDTSILYFKARNGTAFSDTVTILHTGFDHKQFAGELVHFMQVNHRNPFLIMATGLVNTSSQNFITSKIKTTTISTNA
jgi:hypothetical protein